MGRLLFFFFFFILFKYLLLSPLTVFGKSWLVIHVNHIIQHAEFIVPSPSSISFTPLTRIILLDVYRFVSYLSSAFTPPPPTHPHHLIFRIIFLTKKYFLLCCKFPSMPAGSVASNSSLIHSLMKCN